LVYYTLGTDTNAILQRSYLSVPWVTNNWSSVLSFQTNMSGPLGNASDFDTAEGGGVDTVGGVVAFAMLFHLSDGTITNFYGGYNSANPVVAVSVGMAVVDQPTLAILNQVNKLTQLEGALTNSPAFSGTNSMKADWSLMLTPSFYAKYPDPLKTGLKTFERVIPCEPPF